MLKNERNIRVSEEIEIQGCFMCEGSGIYKHVDFEKSCFKCNGEGRVGIVVETKQEIQTCETCYGKGEYLKEISVLTTAYIKCRHCAGKGYTPVGTPLSHVKTVIPFSKIGNLPKSNNQTRNEQTRNEQAKQIINKMREAHAKRINKKSGLTPLENEVMEHIKRAVEIFATLPSTHLDEENDFVDAIHKLQSIVGMRVLRRDYPNYWLNKGDRKK